MNDDLYFTTGSTNPKNVMSLRRLTGNVEVNEGNLVVSKGNIVVGTSGKGIDFSATSNGSGTTSSELLNDYEEGTWSPQIYYQNATDQSNSTNVTQVGTYTKIGRQVTVSGVLQWTITGSPAVDNIGIKNLPFTSLNSSDYFANGVLQLINADTYPSPPVFIQVQSNSTTTEIYGLAGANNLGSSIGSSGTKTARFSLTYFV
jgi:hypothetical protein